MKEYNGKKVRLEDGTEDTVVSSFASGKHVQFTMASGATLLDIHKNEKITLIVDSGDDFVFADDENDDTPEESQLLDIDGSKYGEDLLD